MRVPRHPEHSPAPELTPELLGAYAQTFITRWDCYPQQLPDGSYTRIKKSLTLTEISEHLQGKLTLGAYALNAQNQASWLCLDGDDAEQWQGLLRLAQRLQSQGITSYPERSRRGGHLWLFTTPTDGASIRRFGQGLLQLGKLPPVIELYPKQDQLSTGGVGSLVRLPLGIHRKSGKRYSFITLQGAPLAPNVRSQVAILAQPQRVPDDFIQQTLASLSESSSTKPLPAPTRFNLMADVSDKPLSERLKGAISVLSFASRYSDLDGHGKGLCPFHDDQHSSFQVNDAGNYWSCYAGCGGGSIIDFWMKWRETNGQDVSFAATIKDLAEMLF